MTTSQAKYKETLHTICYLDQELFIRSKRPSIVIKSYLTGKEITYNAGLGIELQKFLENNHMDIIRGYEQHNSYPQFDKPILSLLKIGKERIPITKGFNKDTKEHYITIISDNKDIATLRYYKLKEILKSMNINITHHECEPHNDISIIKKCDDDDD